MTPGTWACVGLAAVLALVDWVAVARSARRVELIAKPAVLVLLVLAAALSDPRTADVKPWVIAALAFGLIGDTALLGAGDTGHRRDRRFFLVGLAAFLLGHLSYLGAMLTSGVEAMSALFGGALALVMVLGCGHRIVSGAHRSGGTVMAGAVIGYIAAVSATVTLGVGTSELLVGYGSVLFAASDLVLGYDRFVRKRHWSRVAVIVTYHLAQFALLIGLAL